MAGIELWLFSGPRWGRHFRHAAIHECTELGIDLTIAVGDPVRSAGTLRRTAIRVTRPARRRFDERRLRAPVKYVEDVTTDQCRRELRRGIHGVIAGYPQIFDRKSIDHFASLVNVHPSVLPLYRGADPCPRSWSTFTRSPLVHRIRGAAPARSLRHDELPAEHLTQLVLRIARASP